MHIRMDGIAEKKASTSVVWTKKDTTHRRNICDAQAVIPYLYGAFRHPSRNGLHLGLPMIEYVVPIIDMNTGRWAYRVKEPLDTVKRIMDLTSISLVDTLRKVSRRRPGDAAGSTGTPTTALTMILKRIDDIDGKIEKALIEHNKQIVSHKLFYFQRGHLPWCSFPLGF